MNSVSQLFHGADYSEYKTQMSDCVQLGSGNVLLLSWFPVEFRIDFKILLITLKTQYGLSPGDITELLTPHESECQI